MDRNLYLTVPGCRGGQLGVVCLVLASSLLVLLTPSGAFASLRVTQLDRGSTRALLEAQYVYEQALVSGAPASQAAEEQLTSSLGSECPGVLANAPYSTVKSLFGPLRSPSPRQVGEANRERRQLGDLQGEFSIALGQSLIESDRQAATTYARTLRSLRWSSGALTVLERTTAAELEWQLRSAPPEVCSDTRAWVASGYKTLSSATKMLIDEREAPIRHVFHVLRDLLAKFPDPSEPLLAYEGPREKALALKIEVLQRAMKSMRKNVTTTLELTLGVAQTAIHAEAEEAPVGPARGSVKIGHGTTAAGGRYTVWLEPKPGSSTNAPRCRLSMEVLETAAESSDEEREIDGTGVNEVCLSRSNPRAPSVQCHDAGLLTIEAQTLPRAHTVLLRLSDGREIGSHIAIVPVKLGGPAGFYYQVVRGPTPIPVTLTEVDAHGNVLRTIRLPRIAKCARQLPKLLPGDNRTIARGTLPQGPSFSIVGERYSFMSKTHFDVRVEVTAGEEVDGFTSGASSIVVGNRLKPTPSPPFALKIATGCLPHEYAILYGILKAPADSVLARSSGSLQSLRRIRIPASLHVHGVLVYIALSTVPSELLVRAPNGKTVFAEKLAGRARNIKETCEGEAEGPSINPQKFRFGLRAAVSKAAVSVLKPSRPLLAGIPQHNETLGSPSAPVRMLLFDDPQSPFSRMWQVQVLPVLVRKYVDTGELQIGWHGFAVLGPASVAGEDFIAAAGLQNHLWDTLDSIMIHQGQENSGWLNRSLLEQIGASIEGFNTAKALSEADSPRIAREISSDARVGEKDGITGVPFMMIGRRGEPLKQLGFADYTPAAFEGPIDRLLRKP